MLYRVCCDNGDRVYSLEAFTELAAAEALVAELSAKAEGVMGVRYYIEELAPMGS